MEVPTGVVAEVAIVSVEVAGAKPAVTDGGKKEQVTPDGSAPGHVRVTGPLNPFVTVTVMVDVADCPAMTATLAGAALALKSGNRPYTTS